MSAQTSDNTIGVAAADLAKSSDNKLQSATATEDRVRVVVRCRPMSKKEEGARYESIVEFEGTNKVVVRAAGESPSDQLGTRSGERENMVHVYKFNAVFDHSTTQARIYEIVCRPIVESVLQGYNGTIFAYGQTGTGKTYTMEGLAWGGLPSSSKRASSNKPSSARPEGGNASSAAAKVPRPGAPRVSSAQTGQRASQIPEATSDAGKCAQPTDQNATDKNVANQDQNAGIIPRAFKQIFEHVDKNPHVQFLIRVSYLEVYQEEIHDLLRRDRSIKLELHERSPDGEVYVQGLTSVVCKSIGEIERVMRLGNRNRRVAATDMNEHSSRSHAIFMITIEQQLTTPKETTDAPFNGAATANQRAEGPTQRNNESAQMSSNSKQTRKQTLQTQRIIRVGKLNLVDLAGSERQRKTNSRGERQKESIKINLSLSALGNVINALMKIHKQHAQQSSNSNNNSPATHMNSQTLFVPYRDSKLTRLLQDSLGGNSKTLMIANIGPASYNYDETINTLNYASRAKSIRNRPHLNEDPKDALLRDLQREIDELRAKLAAIGSSRSAATTANNRGDTGTTGRASTARGSSSGHEDDEAAAAAELAELKRKLTSLESKLLNSAPVATAIDQQLTDEDQLLDQQQRQIVAQGSLLQGYTREQELALERHRAELTSQLEREREIRDEFERRHEAESRARQTFESLQQELATKQKLFSQVLLKTKSMRDQFDDKQRAHSIEVDELDQLRLVLQRELKLKCLIMDNFIPKSHVEQLLPRITYDERSNACAVSSLRSPLEGKCLTDDDEFGHSLLAELDAALGVSGGGKSDGAPASPAKPTAKISGYLSNHPLTEFERMSATICPNDIRFKTDNLIEPQVERFHWQARLMGTGGAGERAAALDRARQVQALVDEALARKEPDIVV